MSSLNSLHLSCQPLVWPWYLQINRWRVRKRKSNREDATLARQLTLQAFQGWWHLRLQNSEHQHVALTWHSLKRIKHWKQIWDSPEVFGWFLLLFVPIPKLEVERKEVHSFENEICEGVQPSSKKSISTLHADRSSATSRRDWIFPGSFMQPCGKLSACFHNMRKRHKVFKNNMYKTCDAVVVDRIRVFAFSERIHFELVIRFTRILVESPFVSTNKIDKKFLFTIVPTKVMAFTNSNF